MQQQVSKNILINLSKILFLFLLVVLSVKFADLMVLLAVRHLSPEFNVHGMLIERS